MAANAAPVIPAAPSAAVVTGYAAVAVLGSRELWDQLTWFMRGYLLVVSTFLRECTRGRMASAMRRFTRKSHASKHLRDSLVTMGRFPHLAIAANDLHMLKALLRLGKKPQYAHDRQLSFAAIHHCAVAFNRRQRASPEVGAVADASRSRARDLDVRVLDQLIQKLPTRRRKIAIGPSERLAATHQKRGQLEVVKYFVESDHLEFHKLELINRAAWGGHLPVVKYLHEKYSDGSVGATTDNWVEKAINRAATSGQVEVVKFLYLNTAQGCHCPSLVSAPRYGAGRFEVVEFLWEREDFDCGAVLAALIGAVPYGDLRTLALLHRKLRAEGESAYSALQEAVLCRQPKSIKYLCEHQNLMLQPMRLLEQAVAEANDEIVRVAAEYANLAELR